jgi:DNA-binding response OmpR family regulator
VEDTSRGWKLVLSAKIMVVDDERDMAEAAKMVLEMEGYEVVIAYDGEEALRKVEAEQPDLVFLDKQMPGKTGVEVCNILKSSAKTKHIPVLIFTASGVNIDDLVAQAGADGYFRKPFAPEDLLAEVKTRLNQARAGKSSNR